jgi:hypothetical protein
MALPAPCHVILSKITEYGYTSPPNIPPLPDIIPSVSHLVPIVAAAIANEAGMKASSSQPRTLCYNLLSANYWNNQDYSDIITMSLDLALLSTSKGLFKSPDQAVYDSVSNVLTLFTSSLVCNFQELKYVCDPQVVEAAYINLSALSNLKVEISDFLNYHQNNVGNNMNNSQRLWDHSNQFGNNNQRINNGGSRSSYAATPVIPNRLGGIDPIFAGGNNRNDVTQMPNNIVEVNRPIVPEVVEQKINNCVLVFGGKEMDRSKHQIVRFGACNQNLEPAHNKLERAVNTFQQAVIDTDEYNKELAVSSLLDIEAPEMTDDLKSLMELFDYTMTPEPYLDTAIANGRLTQLETYCNKNKKVNLSRSFSSISNPIFTIADVKPFIRSLKESNNFSKLAVMLKEITKVIIDKPALNDLVSVISSFDNIMTEYVNDFISNELRLSITITSFLEDIEALGGLLYNKYGDVYGRSFTSFESDMIEVFNNYNYDANIKFIETLAGINIAVVPVNYSLTYLVLDNAELGYDVGKDPLVIDPTITPKLYFIVSSIFSQTKEKGIITTVNLLITSDGIKYKVYNDKIKNEMIIIRA